MLLLMVTSGRLVLVVSSPKILVVNASHACCVLLIATFTSCLILGFAIVCYS